MALLTAIIGIVPSILARNFKAAIITGTLTGLLSWWIYYYTTPSFISPFGGPIAFIVLACWVLSVAIAFSPEYPNEGHPAVPVVMTLLGVAILIAFGISGSPMCNSAKYAQLGGDWEERDWTADVQPKDPKQVRLVPKELAFYLASKQLGEVKEAIGSQFQLNGEHFTLQSVKGELWYVGPLDFRDYFVWNSARYAPGYVMVSALDPKLPVIVKTGCKFQYMAKAWFGSKLERFIWSQSIFKHTLTDFSFEVDDDGNEWWVVTAYRPTIMWGGPKVLGVYIVNPTTGEMQFCSVDETPAWVDRVFPAEFVHSYINWKGLLSGGWMNSLFEKRDLTRPEGISIVYGSDSKPYWVTGITSRNASDQSLLGLVYVETRTGKISEYHAKGGTEDAVVDLVNNKVSYKRLHGSGPVLYNVYGTMTSIVPLLGASRSYQGVAMVDVANMQLVVGDNIEDASRQYSRLIMSGTGQKLAPEKVHDFKTISGIVDSFAQETSGNSETTYYIHLQNVPHLFSGASDLSPKLRMTKEGSQVVVGYIASQEDVVPMASFDLPSLVLAKSPLQESLQQKNSVSAK